MKNSKRRILTLLRLPNWSAGKKDGAQCLSISCPAAGPAEPPSSGRKGKFPLAEIHLINMLPSPSHRRWWILLTFRRDTARWMLIVKRFLIKFNGVRQREVVLAVSILLKKLIVMFGVIGEDNMEMASASVFQSASWRLWFWGKCGGKG